MVAACEYETLVETKTTFYIDLLAPLSAGRFVLVFVAQFSQKVSNNQADLDLSGSYVPSKAS